MDDALVRRADPRVRIFRTCAFRGRTALVRWRNQLLAGPRRHLPRMACDTCQVTDGVGRWRRSATTSLFGFPDDEVGWFGHAVVRGLRIVRRQRNQAAPALTGGLKRRSLHEPMRRSCQRSFTNMSGFDVPSWLWRRTVPSRGSSAMATSALWFLRLTSTLLPRR